MASATQQQPQAGPSRPRNTEGILARTEPEFMEDVDAPRISAPPTGAGPASAAAATATARAGETEEGDEDEERMDLKAIQSIAKYVLSTDDIIVYLGEV